MNSGVPRYRFGAFVLIPSDYTLLRGSEPVRLARMDFDLLVALVEQAGHLVRKEELLQRLWPGAFVEEGNLAKHVSMLRKALGDIDGPGRLIETVPRIGFRFTGSVERLEPAPAILVPEARTGASPRRRSLPVAAAAVAVVAIALVGVVLAARKWTRSGDTPPREWRTLAVLPFRTLEDSSSGRDPLGIALADGIITRLSGQKVLAVRPTSAISGYATDAPRDAKIVGRDLDVGVVLEGHIQRAGNLVRVTVQLTDVAAGAPVWAETFDEAEAELFKLEDSIAERVASALRLQLAAAEQERLRRRYTENGPAYMAYLEGREALLRYTPDGARRAVAAFERALMLDAGYSLARAGLATATAEMYLRFAPESELREWGDRAVREASAALALDPDLAEAHAARAAVFRKREFDWDQTIAESRRALTLNPNLEPPHLYAAAAFYHLGLMEHATTELEQGRRIGGTDIVEPARVEALISLFSGNYRLARQRLEDVSRHSDRAIGDVYLALAQFYLGERATSRRMLEELARERSASTAARAGAALASILAASGEARPARRLIDDVVAGGYRDHHVAYSLGAAFAQLREGSSAAKWLRTAADTGFPCAVWYATDPLLDPIRNDPMFVALTRDLASRRDGARARYASVETRAAR